MNQLKGRMSQSVREWLSNFFRLPWRELLNDFYMRRIAFHVPNRTMFDKF